ncbi:hypothetical protein LCGC14_3157240 [marine sediment metagenome]|uniref:Uncharacterized protein n=1 Tax=marine sediment metagenome TaxID=412755 RepID=A0A0F8WGB3_9ZZZZ
MITLLLPLLTSLGRSLAESLISNEEYLKWIKVAFDVFDSGSELESRFQALEKKLATRLDAGEHFQPADFDAIVKEISNRDEAWADL